MRKNWLNEDFEQRFWCCADDDDDDGGGGGGGGGRDDGGGADGGKAADDDGGGGKAPDDGGGGGKAPDDDGGGGKAPDDGGAAGGGKAPDDDGGAGPGKGADDGEATAPGKSADDGPAGGKQPDGAAAGGKAPDDDGGTPAASTPSESSSSAAAGLETDSGGRFAPAGGSVGGVGGDIAAALEGTGPVESALDNAPQTVGLSQSTEGPTTTPVPGMDSMFPGMSPNALGPGIGINQFPGQQGNDPTSLFPPGNTTIGPEDFFAPTIQSPETNPLWAPGQQNAPVAPDPSQPAQAAPGFNIGSMLGISPAAAATLANPPAATSDLANPPEFSSPPGTPAPAMTPDQLNQIALGMNTSPTTPADLVGGVPNPDIASPVSPSIITSPAKDQSQIPGGTPAPAGVVPDGMTSPTNVPGLAPGAQVNTAPGFSPGGPAAALMDSQNTPAVVIGNNAQMFAGAGAPAAAPTDIGTVPAPSPSPAPSDIAGPSSPAAQPAAQGTSPGAVTPELAGALGGGQLATPSDTPADGGGSPGLADGGGGGINAGALLQPIPSQPDGAVVNPPAPDGGFPTFPTEDGQGGNFNPEQGLFGFAGLPGGPAQGIPFDGMADGNAAAAAALIGAAPAGNFNPNQGLFDVLNNAVDVGPPAGNINPNQGIG